MRPQTTAEGRDSFVQPTEDSRAHDAPTALVRLARPRYVLGVSEHPPPRWLWLALLLVLLLPALPAKQEQSNRRDAIPDLTAARASLVRARIEGCCCDLPHSAALPAPQDPGYDVVVATAQEPENPRARSSAAPAALGPRGPPRS